MGVLMAEAPPVTFEDAVDNVSAALKGETDPNSVSDLRGSLAALETARDMMGTLSGMAYALQAILEMLRDRAIDAERRYDETLAEAARTLALHRVKAAEARAATTAAGDIVAQHIPQVAEALVKAGLK
jgi:hypothetical protein